MGMEMRDGVWRWGRGANVPWQWPMAHGLLVTNTMDTVTESASAVIARRAKKARQTDPAPNSRSVSFWQAAGGGD